MRNKLLFTAVILAIPFSVFSVEAKEQPSNVCPSGNIRYCVSSTASLSAMKCRWEADTQVQLMGIKRDLETRQTGMQKIMDCTHTAKNELTVLSDEFYKKYKNEKQKTTAMKRYMHSYNEYMKGLIPNSYENERDYKMRVDALEKEADKNMLEVDLLFD